MRLDQNMECRQFAEWLLEIGAGQGLNVENEITLPKYMSCGNNLQSLVNALYAELLDPTRNHPLPDGYFLNRTILSAKNVDVNEVNTSILTSLAGDNTVYYSADSVTEQEYNYVPPEFLHTLDPSGFPQHKLELKVGAPLMLL